MQQCIALYTMKFSLVCLLAGVLTTENHLSPVQNILPIALPVDRFVDTIRSFFSAFEHSHVFRFASVFCTEECTI